MKLSKIIYLVLLFCFSSKLYAWENVVTHPAITYYAIMSSSTDDYLKTQMRLTNGITTPLYWDYPLDIYTRIRRAQAEPFYPSRLINAWFMTGSMIEDTEENPAPSRKVAPWRPRHHFHDPIRNAGLDNHTDNPNWNAPMWSDWLPLGTSALTWATTGSASYDPFNNHDKWGTARTIFYHAIIEESVDTRQARLAESLMKLGCVMHLLEDMGVPAHTRNDFLHAHYRSGADHGNELEKWAEKKIRWFSIPNEWFPSGWQCQPKVFSKLTDYFDTNTRVPIDYSASFPASSWGLAECTNYQFFSWSTCCRIDNGNLYYFPHPNVWYCSMPYTDDDKNVYIPGYGVDHLAALGFLSEDDKWDPVEQTFIVTVEKVKLDYAKITIPRTIDYVAGLANYFFRGRMAVEKNGWHGDKDVITITNTSYHTDTSHPYVLKGGVFELYWDNQSDVRTKIDEEDFEVKDPADHEIAWSGSSTLEYNQETIAEFVPPAGQGGLRCRRSIGIGLLAGCSVSDKEEDYFKRGTAPLKPRHFTSRLCAR